MSVATHQFELSVYPSLTTMLCLMKFRFHYNAMISATEKSRSYRDALKLLQEMEDNKIEKNEVTFSSAISSCEKCGEWRSALDLLDAMEREGIQRTSIAYNAAISACEKAMVRSGLCRCWLLLCNRLIYVLFLFCF